jgi:hypothetical protein
MHSQWLAAFFVLKVRAKQVRSPVIHANNSFGLGCSDFCIQVDHCLKGDTRGRPIVELLQPDQDDDFVMLIPFNRAAWARCLLRPQTQCCFAVIELKKGAWS